MKIVKMTGIAHIRTGGWQHPARHIGTAQEGGREGLAGQLKEGRTTALRREAAVNRHTRQVVGNMIADDTQKIMRTT